MANCAIIIPVHEYNDTVKTYLLNAIGSVVAPSNCEVNMYISCPSEITEAIKNDVSSDITIINTAKDSSFQALVNAGVANLKSEDWFSILEFDDTFTNIWIDEFNKHAQYYPETSVFMPLTDLVQDKDDKRIFVGYGNEAPLASAFSNELGYIDFEVLENYFDFYLTGSFFNTKDYLAVGGLKESMKLTFWYEFMLRMTHKGKKIQVIPKVGYCHLLNRKDSLFAIYGETMSAEENKWWQELAKEEYRYTKDRNKQYKGEEEE